MRQLLMLLIIFVCVAASLSGCTAVRKYQGKYTGVGETATLATWDGNNQVQSLALRLDSDPAAKFPFTEIDSVIIVVGNDQPIRPESFLGKQLEVEGTVSRAPLIHSTGKSLHPIPHPEIGPYYLRTQKGKIVVKME